MPFDFAHARVQLPLFYYSQALALSTFILYGSLPTLFDARTDDRRGVSVFKASVPSEIRTGMQSAYDQAGLGK
jgi:hypothetical protein